MNNPTDTPDHKKSFLIIAGEPSGDTHGAGFIRALREKIPGCSVFGIGGDMMRKEGMEILFSIEKMAILGIVEVIRHLPFIGKVFQTLIREARKRKPTAVILIDYPDFNVRFAKKIRRHLKSDIKILYYISPQVWAWRKSRIKTIARYIDAMAVVFPFEEKLYRDADMLVRFVGHPLLDIVKPSLSKNDFCKKYNVTPEQPIIGLLPGSRHQEIVRHLPVILEAMHLVQRELKNIQVLIGKARHIPESVFNAVLSSSKFRAVLADDVYNIMHYSTLTVVSSGTATLETAIAGTPMIIVYKMAPFTYFIARRMVSLPFIGMANIVHEKKVVPELIQNDVRSDKISGEVMQLLSDNVLYTEMQRTLANTRSLLGEPGAAQRAVELLFEILD